MSDAAFLVLLVGFPVLGLASRRWFTALGPAVAWPVFYLGDDQGWWGPGASDADGLWSAAFLLTMIGIGSTALAVAVGRAVRRP